MITCPFVKSLFFLLCRFPFLWFKSNASMLERSLKSIQFFTLINLLLKSEVLYFLNHLFYVHRNHIYVIFIFILSYTVISKSHTTDLASSGLWIMLYKRDMFELPEPMLRAWLHLIPSSISRHSGLFNTSTGK